MEFENFTTAVINQLNKMVKQSTELFYVDIDKDKLWNIYLSSFSSDIDPLFRERTVHDCQTCKRFIRQAGNIVAVINGRVQTIWDIETDGVEQYYVDTATSLAAKVIVANIEGTYRTKEKTLGGASNRQELENGIINIYDHFHYVLPPRFVSNDLFTIRGNARTNKEVLERSLVEISLDAGETVLDLITENQLYRGQEHLHAVEKFVAVKREFERCEDQQVFLWQQSVVLKESGRFKNTVIGTLLHDLSTGTPLEQAVASFESKVAPTNYKRPKALVTQAMLDRAEEKITELGLGDSLTRRHAVPRDLTINNVLFVDKKTKKKLKKDKKKGVLADIEPTKTAINPDKLEKVPIEEFINNILPQVDGVEIMVENSHINNLMSVIAPSNAKSPNLMKWNNPFSWSYNGEVTDSIKERVKRAGGSVTGYMRCSLSWYNYDDLDLHAIEPSGNRISYQRKVSPSGGRLDVDMNVHNYVRDPVENITWEQESYLREGTYRFYVNSYTKRETDNIGFQVEFELNGQTQLFTYDKPMRQGEDVPVIEFKYAPGKDIVVNKSLPSSDINKEVWGINTQQWTKVNMVMLSPNHWNGEKNGNKHWFFILENCLNPDKTRGFYNEFLGGELNDHRKVFELLSSKMKVEYSDKQLSGIGFSSTLPNRLLCKVSGKFDQIMEITFAPDKEDRFDTKQTASVIYRCEICKSDVLNIDSHLPCPNCNSIFHTSHFLETVRIFAKCPVCTKSVTQQQVNTIVQLATV